MRMGFGKVLVDLFQKCLLRAIPKGRVVAESTVLPLTYCNYILMTKRFPSKQPLHRLRNAGRVVKHPKRIHQSIEAQATAKAAHLVSKAGA